IPETVDIRGTALSPRHVVTQSVSQTEIFCYIPIDEARQLNTGMRVRVSPDWAPREQYGYIIGMVKSVGDTPVHIDNLRDELGEYFEFLYLPVGNLIEVIVEMETHTDGSLRWSKSQNTAVNLTVGTICNLTVITAERRPIELMFR
ncbi:MAG: hypothetical protein LBC71_02325, partial [Oscillospiraceae bacterium]|nr:hypothetical protein [Oscillospiraceae bacterium]